MITDETLEKLKTIRNTYEEMDALSVCINQDLRKINLCRELRAKNDNEIYEDYIRLIKTELSELNQLIANKGEVIIKNIDFLDLIPKHLRYGVAIQFIIEDLEDVDSIEEAIQNYEKALENPPDDMKAIIVESQKVARDREGYLYTLSENNEQFKSILSEITVCEYVIESKKKIEEKTEDVFKEEVKKEKEPLLLKSIINLLKTKSE